jgi:concentrative nucleoside transporter, CNT family
VRAVDLKLVSLLGLFVMIALAWVCSMNRRQFPWRTVWAGLALQFIFATAILKTNFGATLFDFANRAVNRLLSFADEGARMVFGPLAQSELLAESWGPENTFIFVVTVTATIILVSALSSLLYHYGILQVVVRGMAWVMQRVMRTSGSESLAAAANIFMGQTEAPLVVKPYLARMTKSELLALMVPGMASIAGGVLAAYVAFGRSAGRTDMAGHLLTASFMSAPAALLIAKIMLPETEVSETVAGAPAKIERESTNGLDALCRGASEGMMLSINVMAMLIAFVAVVAMTNFLLSYPQTRFGVAEPVTLEIMFGWINAPIAWLIGIPWKDCLAVGALMGERIVLNEFIAYLHLPDKAAQLDPRSFTLATYALCGFANFSSIAIQIGGIGALAPNRRADLAQLGLRAMLGGLLSCYMTAALVGVLL